MSWCFIDEIDATLSLPFPRDDFFAAIRALHNRQAERPGKRRLTFCLLGVAAPADLIDDPTRTPFNIGRAIRLEDFTREEMANFAPGLEPLGPRAAGHLDAIFEWTSGHPYMTQRICEELVAGGPGEGSAEGLDGVEAPAVDAVVHGRFLASGRAEDANLRAMPKNASMSVARGMALTMGARG